MSELNFQADIEFATLLSLSLASAPKTALQENVEAVFSEVILAEKTHNSQGQGDNDIEIDILAVNNSPEIPSNENLEEIKSDKLFDIFEPENTSLIPGIISRSIGKYNLHELVTEENEICESDDKNENEVELKVINFDSDAETEKIDDECHIDNETMIVSQPQSLSEFPGTSESAKVKEKKNQEHGNWRRFKKMFSSIRFKRSKSK